MRRVGRVFCREATQAAAAAAAAAAEKAATT
jgi:hypothetical protein